MKIKVEQRHIDEGLCWDPHGCAIALAALDAGVGQRLSVGPGEITIYDPESVTVRLPREAVFFIADFDSNRTVQPFEFDIDIPEHPPNEIVCPVQESPLSQNAVRNESHSLIADLLKKIEREPRHIQLVGNEDK